MALTLRGINYDTGTEFEPGESTRPHWLIPDVEHDLAAIRDDLGCNSVAIFGTGLDRIVAAARVALDLGLHVVLQLRSIDVDRRATLARIADAARAARALDDAGRVMLNLGCEMTLFTRGFLPGRTFLHRIRNLRWSWPWLAIANPTLSAFLARAGAAVRAEFAGPLTYGAGPWERVDWQPFDFVGVDLYRDHENAANYPDVLRRYFAHGKPVLVTEFGCCAYEGADGLGGMGWTALDRSTDPPTVRPGITRSEDVQARTLGELIDLYEREGVHGAWIYDFLQQNDLHDDDPRHDLDRAGYGIVKPRRRADGGVTWEPKLAFHAVAERYRRGRSAADA